LTQIFVQMTFSQTYRIYEIFNSYFKNEEDAKRLTSEIEELINGRVVSDRVDLATKSDIAQLSSATKADIAQLSSATKEDIAQLRSATKEDIAQLRSATKADIAQLSSETKADISQLRVETKADIAQLRIETKTEIKQLELRVEQGFRDNLKWTVTTMVGIAAIMLAIIKLS
jgi:tRNA U34 5-carboxymethylaminomethyl modifying GTPase MnmE/TrmE